MTESNDTIKVTAPNDKVYTFHPGSGRKGFVYASGRRVYGRILRFEWNAKLDRAVGIFVTSSKHASLVTPVTETVGV